LREPGDAETSAADGEETRLPHDEHYIRLGVCGQAVWGMSLAKQTRNVLNYIKQVQFNIFSLPIKIREKSLAPAAKTPFPWRNRSLSTCPSCPMS